MSGSQIFADWGGGGEVRNRGVRNLCKAAERILQSEGKG